jgi:hypothetical protein
MKKAKIILTMIAVLAVVGGALAFKAKRNTRLLYIPAGETITTSVIAGFVYTTSVPFCVVDPQFFSTNVGPLNNTFYTTVQTVTGFAPNGHTRTWLEVVCTPILTALTTVP